MPEPQGTILVVDDELKNSKLLEALLVPRGYKVIKACNGQEAIDKAREHLPDLILLDAMMPIMNGFDACKVIKEDDRTRTIPVVFMTALGQVEDRIKAIEAGADDFLTKPVNRDELMARIRTSVRQKQRIDQRVNMLETALNQLKKFVPQSVQEGVAGAGAAPGLEKRKRDVSALFVDITGYTRLSETLSQDHVNFIVESLFSGFIDSIKANGGEVGSTAGDGMMVIFPHEDPAQNARSAVKTALAILKLTGQHDEQPLAVAVFDQAHEPITVHIGINSGEAMVGPAKFEGASGEYWAYTAVGSAVNVAARIGALAEGGTILVSAETARRVEGSFSVKELGPREFKNVSQPVVVYQIVDQVSQ